MPVSGGGFEQAYNAQAAVDVDSMLVVAQLVTQAPNDKEQVVPMLKQIAHLPESLGTPNQLLADTGYFSAKNVDACEAVKIEPLIAIHREEHHPDWRERFTEPAALPEGATPVESMAHRLKTKAGRAAYALRKQTVEVAKDKCLYCDANDFACNDWIPACGEDDGFGPYRHPRRRRGSS